MASLQRLPVSCVDTSVVRTDHTNNTSGFQKVPRGSQKVPGRFQEVPRGSRKVPRGQPATARNVSLTHSLSLSCSLSAYQSNEYALMRRKYQSNEHAFMRIAYVSLLPLRRKPPSRSQPARPQNRLGMTLADSLQNPWTMTMSFISSCTNKIRAESQPSSMYTSRKVRTIRGRDPDPTKKNPCHRG